MSTDARYRSLLFTQTYYTSTNVTKDDDATTASVIFRFEKDPTPVERIFFDLKQVDGIYTYGTPTSVALVDYKKEAYAYIETVPITISCVTKPGITGDKLRWKMETELRRIIETYPLGSVRKLTRVSPVDEDKSLWKLHSVRYELEYKRAVDDYTSDATLAYGFLEGFQYDGDRLANGSEGTWTLTNGGNTSQSVTSNPGLLTLYCSAYVADSYTISGDPAGGDTNLGINSTIYTKLKFKHKTTSSAKIKIILGYTGYDSAQTPEANVADGDAVVALSETSSTSWTITSFSIPTAKIVDHVIVHLCDGAGYVYVDWIKIYKGDFTLPNLVNAPFNPTSRNVDLGIVSGLGLGLQNLGSPPTSLELLCDLDIETDTTAGNTGCWQLASGDDNEEVFLYVQHENDRYGYWSWLTWGNKAMRVVIDSVDVDPREGICRVMLHEKVDVNADTHNERWNL